MTTEIDSDSSDDDLAKAFQPLIDTNMFFLTLDEPTESEKHAMSTKSYISDAFDYSHEFQMVKALDLWEYREFDRSLMPKAGNNHDHLEQVRRFILKNGFQEPIIISVILQLEKPISLKETIVFGWPFRKVYHSYHVVLFLTGCPPTALTKSLKLIFPL